MLLHSKARLSKENAKNMATIRVFILSLRRSDKGGVLPERSVAGRTSSCDESLLKGARFPGQFLPCISHDETERHASMLQGEIF